MRYREDALAKAREARTHAGSALSNLLRHDVDLIDRKWRA
jgi:hypothetical protein